MRNSVACVACRSVKRQCLHDHGPPCKRCKDRSETCIFPAPGTSSSHRLPKTRRDNEQTSAVSPLNLSGQSGPLPRRESQVSQDESVHDISKTNPLELFTDEVKNSYLQCSYKWCFHHIPSLLVEMRKGTLDHGVAWSILALAIRFSNNAPQGFSTPLEASNVFAAHARSTILPYLEEPSISRVQTLLVLTGHSWGAGEGRRAWTYLGMAVRMAQMLGLLDEGAPSRSREEFIEAESRRRTAWTCFLMDSLLSGGKGRRRSLTADDMRIQLPVDSDNFNFGEIVRCERLNGTLPDHRTGTVGRIGMIAYSMRVADIWGAVARWAYSSAADSETPWDTASEFQNLLRRLNDWYYDLPERLKYSVFLLHAHSASNQGQAYCYCLCIYFMSIMILHRSYLREPVRETQPIISPVDQKRRQWQAYCRRELFRVADQVGELLEEVRSFGLSFLRGLVPWIGFTTYTAIGTMLYFYHFPDPGADIHMKQRIQDRVGNSLAFLKDMRGSWPMADTWRETIKQMHIYYGNVKMKGESGVSISERRQMRNAIVDYGALQASPVEEPNAPMVAPTLTSRPTSDAVSQHKADFAPERVPQEDIFSTDLNLFDTTYPMDTEEWEAMVAHATQGFWANFPGEVGVY